MKGGEMLLNMKGSLNVRHLETFTRMWLLFPRRIHITECPMEAWITVRWRLEEWKFYRYLVVSIINTDQPCLLVWKGAQDEFFQIIGRPFASDIASALRKSVNSKVFWRIPKYGALYRDLIEEAKNLCLWWVIL